MDSLAILDNDSTFSLSQQQRCYFFHFSDAPGYGVVAKHIS